MQVRLVIASASACVSASGESGANGGMERIAKRSRSAPPAAEPQTEALRPCELPANADRDERTVCVGAKGRCREGDGDEPATREA